MAYTAFTTSLLACKIPAQLATLLGFASYQDLSALVYPAPKYSVFGLAKRGGGYRTIFAPRAKLKNVQRKLAAAFYELDNSRPAAHGFRVGRSIASNATAHLGKQYVFNLDLENFFPSIHFGRIRGLFQAAPFNFAPPLAAVLARLCTYRGILPQGAPTSPVLSNFVCRSMDGNLQALAKQNYATYTRYADDLTFSFSRKRRDQLPPSIVRDAGHVEAGAELELAIQKNGFKVNKSKTRLRSRHARMEVTGLTVNDRVNVRRSFVDEIRGALHAWEKYGLAATQAQFATGQYRRQLRTNTTPPVEAVLRGKLLYLHMIKGVLDPVYSRLARRFNSCVSSTAGCSVGTVPVSHRALSEGDLERAVFVLSARDDANSYEIKGTCFFASGIGLVTADHCLKYPPSNLDANGFEMFPATLCGVYFTASPSGALFLQDTLESDLCALNILWADKTADLAVLQMPIGTVLPHLAISLEDMSSIIGGHPVRLVGFPFHNPGKSISVADGKIRSRFKRYGIAHFDISPLIRTGNSGGPVISQSYQLIGVAIEGEKQDGGNNAVVQAPELTAKHAYYATNPWVVP
jgi:RNA-directed DNA polymerase